MNTFVIDSDNNITIFGPGEELPKTEQTPKFKSREELGQLAESWPAERLVGIWNTLPGARPVKKFTNRNTAVSRVWKALQSLSPVVAPDVAHVAAVAASAGKKATRPKKGTRSGKAAKSSKKVQKPESHHRERSRGQQERQGTGPSPTGRRRHPEGDYEGYWLAAAFRPRVHQWHPRQEDGLVGNVH